MLTAAANAASQQQRDMQALKGERRPQGRRRKCVPARRYQGKTGQHPARRGQRRDLVGKISGSRDVRSRRVERARHGGTAVWTVFRLVGCVAGLAAGVGRRMAAMLGPRSFDRRRPGLRAQTHRRPHDEERRQHNRAKSRVTRHLVGRCPHPGHVSSPRKPGGGLPRSAWHDGFAAPDRYRSDRRALAGRCRCRTCRVTCAP